MHVPVEQLNGADLTEVSFNSIAFATSWAIDFPPKKKPEEMNGAVTSYCPLSDGSYAVAIEIELDVSSRVRDGKDTTC